MSETTIQFVIVIVDKKSRNSNKTISIDNVMLTGGIYLEESGGTRATR